MQLRSQSFHLKRVVVNLHYPKQSRRPDTAIKIVQLHRQARTGLKEVNSNEDERASVMRAVG